MKPAKGRRSRGADAPPSETVKTSMVIGRDLHARWQAAASIRGMTANALAVEALKAATRWVVIHDKRRSSDPVEADDRPRGGDDVNPDDRDAAA